jgi:hypothetical protein
MDKLLGKCIECCEEAWLDRCESRTADTVGMCGVQGYVSDARTLSPDERFYLSETRAGYKTECLFSPGSGCTGSVGASTTENYNASQTVTPPSSCARLRLSLTPTSTSSGCSKTGTGTFPPVTPSFPGTPAVDTPVFQQYINTGACQSGSFDSYSEWDITTSLENPDTVYAALGRGTFTSGSLCVAGTPSESTDGRTLTGGVTAVLFYLKFQSVWASSSQDVRITYRTTNTSTGVFDDLLIDDITVAVDSDAEAGPITIPQPPAGFTRKVQKIERL